MKLLNIFNHYLQPGGEATAVESITKSLSKKFTVRNCEYTSTSWTGADAPPQWKQAWYMIHNSSSVQKLRREHENFSPDCWLVHNVFPVGSLAVYKEAKRLRVPVIQYLHNFRPFSVNGSLWANGRLAPNGLSKNYWEEIRGASWRNSHLKTAWLAFVLSLGHATRAWDAVTSWIALSNFSREKFIEAGISSPDIFTLRHFWNPKAHDAEYTGTHFLYLGRLEVAKGVLVLLKTWEMLERDYGATAPQLVIAGDGPLHDVVAEHATRLRSIRFAGLLSGEAKRDALEKSKAVIVPSLWWEPLGLVVYEAYEYQRPVLASRSGGLPEIVSHTETGLLHQPGSHGELATQVLEIQKEYNMAKEMGRKGREWLVQNATEDNWLTQFSKILVHAINK
jgi:glycosyltransferase involved in cell wall biosynthesis